jgi:hypothetical protein
MAGRSRSTAVTEMTPVKTMTEEDAAVWASELGGRRYDKSSVDSQFTDDEEELTFLDACVDCDDEALFDIIQDGVTWDQVNERDKSGRVSALFSECSNG